MQENNSRDFDKIIPMKEAGEMGHPSCKASAFSPLAFVGALVPAIRLEEHGPTQMCF